LQRCTPKKGTVWTGHGGLGESGGKKTEPDKTIRKKREKEEGPTSRSYSWPHWNYSAVKLGGAGISVKIKEVYPGTKTWRGHGAERKGREDRSEGSELSRVHSFPCMESPGGNGMGLHGEEVGARSGQAEGKTKVVEYNTYHDGFHSALSVGKSNRRTPRRGKANGRRGRREAVLKALRIGTSQLFEQQLGKGNYNAGRGVAEKKASAGRATSPAPSLVKDPRT